MFGWASNTCSALIASEHHKGSLLFRLDDQGLPVFALGIDAVLDRRELPGTDPLPKGWRVVERMDL